ncbi:6551_t:CDS:1, partial [Cetraspora pellucida]
LPFKLKPFNSIFEKNKYANKTIFGISTFTENMLNNFEKTFHNFLEVKLNNWDENDLINKIAQG